MIAIRMTGRREHPAESCDALAAELLSLLRQLQKLAPSGAKWAILSRSCKRVPIHAVADLTKHLAASRSSRVSERVRGAPTHSATLTCCAGKTDAFHLALRFCVASDPAPRAALTVQLSIHETMFSGSPEPRARAVELFTTLISRLELDAARAITGADPAPPPSDSAVRLGSLTFFPSRLGPLPPLPPDCEVAATLGSGCVLAAHRGLPESGCAEQAISLAYLRFVLGARVLLDGPAIPPPGFAAPPVATEPVPVTPPENVPTYLKVASESARGRPPVPESGMPPSPAATPAPPVDTGEVDVGRLFKAPMPFVPGTAPPSAAPHTASSPLPRTMSSTSLVNVSEILKGPTPFEAGEAPAGSTGSAATVAAKSATTKREAQPAAASIGATEEIRVSDLLRRGLAVPFSPTGQAALTPEPPPPSPAPGPGSPAAATPPAPQGRGRWIRFNPQTGEPLAQPYWEELPPGAK